jgi:hypothetical protein
MFSFSNDRGCVPTQHGHLDFYRDRIRQAMLVHIDWSDSIEYAALAIYAVGDTVRDKVNKILNYSFIYHAVVYTVVKLYLPFPYNSCTVPNDPCFSVASY